jgi:hypothetical protein
MENEQIIEARKRLIASLEKARVLDEELDAATSALAEEWAAETNWASRADAARAEMRRLHLEYELLKNRPVKFALSSS